MKRGAQLLKELDTGVDGMVVPQNSKTSMAVKIP